MHAIDKRRARLFQGLGGGHVGEDHELLDEAVGIEPVGHDDAVDGPVRPEKDLALGEVEVEWPTLLACAPERCVGGPKRPEDWLEKGRCALVGLAVDGALCLLV